jgi:phospholipid transport system substrate-binding protein
MKLNSVRIIVWTQVLALILVLSLGIGGTCAMAPGPAENLQGFVDEVLAILNNPAYRPPARRRNMMDLLGRIADRYFDFREMGKRSLGDAWNHLSQTQQDEFVQHFTALWRNSYFRTIFTCPKAKVSYLPEIHYSDHVEVPVVFRPPNDKIPLIFRMRRDGVTWKIYDVVIQEVSLVDNYQRQFARFIQQSSFPNLLKVLKGKIQQAQLLSRLMQPDQTAGEDKNAEH